jgi:hypothetical protein
MCGTWGKKQKKKRFCFSKKRNNWILPSVSGLMRRLCDTARAFGRNNNQIPKTVKTQTKKKKTKNNPRDF